MPVTQSWDGYRVCTSIDRQTWTRVETNYHEGVLTIEHCPEGQLQWYAYFAPHTHEQHLDLLAHCQLSDHASIDRLGATVDGRDLHRVTLGDGDFNFWIIARQHPGESMASWWMEGFLARLLDTNDPLANALLEKATIHVVPHMNPDGAIRGHLRCNAAGANLNREWAAPTLERSPEVYFTRTAMDASGVDFCLDVHGDEELPYNFLAGAEGIPGYEETQIDSLCEVFATAYVRANPDLQREYGYKKAAPGKANMTMCTKAVAHRFQCPAYTLEMPFKDNANAPDDTVDGALNVAPTLRERRRCTAPIAATFMAINTRKRLPVSKATAMPPKITKSTVILGSVTPPSAARLRSISSQAEKVERCHL